MLISSPFCLFPSQFTSNAFGTLFFREHSEGYVNYYFNTLTTYKQYIIARTIFLLYSLWKLIISCIKHMQENLNQVLHGTNVKMLTQINIKVDWISYYYKLIQQMKHGAACKDRKCTKHNEFIQSRHNQIIRLLFGHISIHIV